MVLQTITYTLSNYFECFTIYIRKRLAVYGFLVHGVELKSKMCFLTIKADPTVLLRCPVLAAQTQTYRTLAGGFGFFFYLPDTFYVADVSGTFLKSTGF